VMHYPTHGNWPFNSIPDFPDQGDLALGFLMHDFHSKMRTPQTQRI
jgi:hypothetical protein